MTSSPPHRPRHSAAAENDTTSERRVDDVLPVDTPAGTWHDADCCVARAVYRVVLPPTPDRPRPAELFLCGHHYRRSAATLLNTFGAEVYDEAGQLVAWTSVLREESAHALAR